MSAGIVPHPSESVFSSRCYEKQQIKKTKRKTYKNKIKEKTIGVDRMFGQVIALGAMCGGVCLYAAYERLQGLWLYLSAPGRFLSYLVSISLDLDYQRAFTKCFGS